MADFEPPFLSLNEGDMIEFIEDGQDEGEVYTVGLIEPNRHHTRFEVKLIKKFSPDKRIRIRKRH